jgi:D-glycero-beta-D-manno-heptose-7-phosphate kinase
MRESRRATRYGEDGGPGSARLLEIVDRFRGRRIVVVGDIIADEFIYGQIARVSREAPVLILKYDSTEVVPGGAGNAANNIAALGGSAALCGIVGNDEAGRRMMRAMHRGVERTALVRSNGQPTPTKTRILAGGVHSAKQQVVRIDREVPASTAPATLGEFERRALEAVEGADGLLLSDYGSGLITRQLVERLADRMTVGSREKAPPILVDSRYSLLQFAGLTACTPNESEVEQLLQIKIDDDLDTLEKAGRELLKRMRHEAVLITRGSRGMALFEPRRSTVQIPIFGSDEIADVTGAGDTVIATMALALASGASFCEAARLANYAGGLVVMKRGTATITAEELQRAITVDAPQSADRDLIGKRPTFRTKEAGRPAFTGTGRRPVAR